jgi:hypothetical protein
VVRGASRPAPRARAPRGSAFARVPTGVVASGFAGRHGGIVALASHRARDVTEEYAM